MAPKKAPPSPLKKSPSLAVRHNTVTKITQKYFKYDICPPTTVSSILVAQKFAAAHHYLVTAFIFCYAFLIPFLAPAPVDASSPAWYTNTYHGNTPMTIIFGIFILIPLLRLFVVSWNAAFYQFVVLLISVETIVFVFVCLFVSPGLTALLVIMVSNLINVSVSQMYWGNKFMEVASCLKDLVPEGIKDPNYLGDTTQVSVWNGWSKLFKLEWVLLMGFKDPKTRSQLYEERCGVFSQKESDFSHAEAMQMAYDQAINPHLCVVQWARCAAEACMVSAFGALDGLLSIFVSNVVYAFGGLWLSKACFENSDFGGWAISFAAILVGMFVFSAKRTYSWLEEGLGVAVAEKEWLAYDVAIYAGEREVVDYDVMDTQSLWNSPTRIAREKHTDRDNLTPEDLQATQNGRLNLVHMWLCVASVADFIGETYLSRIFWNLSLESKNMIESLTFFEFRLYYDSKWEVMHKGCVIRSIEACLLTFMTALYFSNFFDRSSFPDKFFAFIGACCILVTAVRLVEAFQFVFTILAQAKDTQRSTYVVESVAAVIVLCVFAHILIWCYMLPVMESWEPPIGRCGWHPNRIFGLACPPQPAA